MIQRLLLALILLGQQLQAAPSEGKMAKLPKWFKNRAPSQDFEIEPCHDSIESGDLELDPSKLGPDTVESKFITLESSLTSREITAQYFSPKKTDCNRFELKNNPLVIFLAPGFIGSIPWPLDLGKSKLYDMQVYEGYMHHLASYGYNVLGLYEPKGSLFSKLDSVDHKRDALEISSFITDIIRKKETHGLDFDVNRIALMGHSKGAKLAFYSATMDKRIKIILAVDPVNSGGPPCFISKSCTKFPVAPNPKNGDKGILDQITATTLVFKAPIDRVWNPDPQFNAVHFYNGLNSETYLTEVKAGHASWMFNEKIKSLTRAIFVSFLDRHFEISNEFAKYLDGEGLEHHEEKGLLLRRGYKSDIGEIK